jgi:hypothetical protein
VRTVSPVEIGSARRRVREPTEGRPPVSTERYALDDVAALRVAHTANPLREDRHDRDPDAGVGTVRTSLAISTARTTCVRKKGGPRTRSILPSRSKWLWAEPWRRGRSDQSTKTRRRVPCESCNASFRLFRKSLQAVSAAVLALVHFERDSRTREVRKRRRHLLVENGALMSREGT